MKRLISVILVLAMSMALCACQKDDTPQTISKTTKIDSIVVGDTVYFGFYEQDADSSNGTEAIEWEVLAVDGSNVLLISRYGLDGQDYHTSGKDVTWETSTLREWLNQSFYNAAFSVEEQALIAESTINPDKHPEYDTDPGNATQDKVFILSMSEAKEYMPNNSNRLCWPTEYARQRGAFASKAKDSYETGACGWWLRTPGMEQNRAVYTMCGGSFFTSGIDGNTNSMAPAVRPVIWISLS